MNIYVEIMSIYGITFLVSMFVALIIWGMAKLVDALPEEPFSLTSIFKKLRQNMILGNNERKQFLKDFRETRVEGSEDLINYHHEHA
jgi:hypothetical protein